MDTFWSTLDNFANLIEIGTFVLVLFLFVQTHGQLRRYRQAREGTLGTRPWVLAVGIGTDISGQVKGCLDELDLEGVSIETYSREGRLTSDQFYEVLKDILKIKGKLTEAGATELHLFYMGPVTLAMGVGAVLDNWIPVKVYKYADGTYTRDFVLEKGTVLGLLGTGLSDALGEISEP